MTSRTSGKIAQHERDDKTVSRMSNRKGGLTFYCLIVDGSFTGELSDESMDSSTWSPEELYDDKTVCERPFYY